MVKINDVTLRDGQQSLLAGRVQQADLLRAAQASKNLPYNMFEVWGGTCFDMPLKEKGENPFQNLREFRETLGADANLSMLLRCQNLVGYEGHDMSIVQSFVEEAAKPFGHSDARDGINTFRVFDSLNDINKLTPVIQAVRALKDDRGWNVSAQGTLSYTVIDDAQRKDVIAHGGDADLYTPTYFANIAKQLVDAGAESICIKDMAGLLDAEHTAPLVHALKAAVDVPIVLHAQSGLGLSDEAIIAAIEAGIDEVDTTSIAMSGGAGHSATETILDAIKRRCPKHLPTGFDEAALKQSADAWRTIRPKYAQFENPYDPDLQRLIQQSQVPGGMTTTLRKQITDGLSKKTAADPKDVDIFLKATLMEMANVRRDVGYITLVTPSSQVVGTQAISNVAQVFHILKHEGKLSLDAIGKAIAENRENGNYLNVMTPPFAKLVMGQLGALPYQPVDEIVQRAQQLASDKPLATLAERKAELRQSIAALLNPERVEGMSEERKTEMLQRRGLLSQKTIEQLDRIAYEPTAQELLMYAIKPVPSTPERQTRLMSLIHQLEPKAAASIGYGADEASQDGSPDWPGKAFAASRYGIKDAEALAPYAESYAQAALALTRLKDGAVKFSDDEKGLAERAYRIAFVEDTLAQLEDEVAKCAESHGNSKAYARFFADMAATRADQFGIALEPAFIASKISSPQRSNGPSVPMEDTRGGSWQDLAAERGVEARRDNPRFR